MTSLLLNSELEESIDLFKLLSIQKPLIASIMPMDGEWTLKAEMAAVAYHHQAGYATSSYASSLQEIPANSFLLLGKKEDSYVTLLALSHQGCQLSFSGSREGFILQSKKSGQSHQQEIPAFIAVLGDDFEYTIHLAMQLAIQLTGGLGKIAADKLSPPSWLGYLGWDSKTALGTDITEDKILEGVSSLRSIGALPGYVIIGEGWQDIDHKSLQLRSFQADYRRFPGGLKNLIDELRRLGVLHVGVWHGFFGARFGISQELAGGYDLTESNTCGYIVGDDLGKAFQFYFDYYESLRKQGVAFIQVGNQTEGLQIGLDPTALYRNLQSAMQGAASLHFRSAHLNTSSLFAENLFYWNTSRYCRVAEPIDRGNSLGIKRSIYNHLMNAVWVKHLMIPDYDPWVSEDSEAVALLHALSGSLRLLGDAPGRHNFAYLKKTMLLQGEALFADVPLTPCVKSVFSNALESKEVFKACTKKAEAGIVAAFNLTRGRRSASGMVSSNDAALGEGVFAVYSYLHGFLGVSTNEESIPITLKSEQADAFTFVPIKNGIAVIGCYEFYLPRGPIREVHIEEDDVYIVSKIAAPLLVFCDHSVLEVRRNDKTVPWELGRARHILSIDIRAQILPEPSIYHIVFEN